jgi:3-dehydroquinate synthase
VKDDILKVRFGPRTYNIRFGARILSEIGSISRALELGEKVAVITNPTVGKEYSGTVNDSLVRAGFSSTIVEIPDGESFKNSETLNTVYDSLIRAGLSRDSFLIALGGGVVGDLTGFAASTYLRGIPFVQIPTSLLAQVDSSVGGKTGINHPLGKNLIGSFYQPRMVLIDISTLSTLPEREYLSGLAEVIKYGVVCDDEFFDYLADNTEKLIKRDSDCLLAVIRSSCRIKAAIVERDEQEGGCRAVLNYGHTFAHAIESLAGYSEYLHGEAVAIGMVQSAVLSEKKGYSRPEDTKRIIDLIRSLRLPVELTSFSEEAFRQVMLRDKKVRDGGINFVFNKRIGESVIEKVADWDFLLQNVSR